MQSEPSGAEVRLDDQMIGTTPVRVSFKDYGTRRLTLTHEGFANYSEAVAIEPPWWAAFPMDILTEVIVPLGWRDVHHFRIQLVRGASDIPAPDLESVLERAESLRRAGPEGPGAKKDDAAKKSGGRNGSPR